MISYLEDYVQRHALDIRLRTHHERIDRHDGGWQAEGIFARLRRDDKAPAIVDKEIIRAIRARRIEITAGVEALEQASLLLAEGTRIEADAVIAATGYTTGLETLAGHLGLLNHRGLPHVHGGKAAAPGAALHRLPPQARTDRPHGPRGTTSRRAIKNETSLIRQ